jgi:hypothetical protein
MTHHDDLSRDPELAPLIARLQDERPTASPLELDAIKQRARSRATRTRSRRTEPMRSRIAILATLVLGIVLSTGGASLAVSGFASSDHNAAATQYLTNTPTPTGGGGNVLGEEESGGGGSSPAGGGGSPSGTAGEENGVQPARQVEAGAQGGTSQLPFTGFAAIPILLGGVALLATGLVLRRRTNDQLS